MDYSWTIGDDRGFGEEAKGELSATSRRQIAATITSPRLLQKKLYGFTYHSERINKMEIRDGAAETAVEKYGKLRIVLYVGNIERPDCRLVEVFKTKSLLFRRSLSSGARLQRQGSRGRAAPAEKQSR
ncbi:hypothetical protein U1Q18_048656 [Sarracenia purpurea var. burkii]